MILRQVSSARSSSRKCCRKKGRASQTREKAKMGVNEQVASVGTWGSILLGSMPRHIRTPAWRVEEPTSRVTTSQSYTLRSALVRCYCWPLGHDSLPFCFSAFQSQFSSVQFISVAQSCPTRCDPMDCSTSGFPVYHQVPEPTQTHVHCVSDAIQPSHLLSSPSPPAFNLSQHQDFF